MSTPDAPEPIRIDARFATAVAALLAFAVLGPIAGRWIGDTQPVWSRTWLLLATAVPCAGLAAVTFAAWRSGWARRSGFVACAVLFAAGDVLTLSQIQALRERSAGKAVISALRRLSSTADQFFLEHPERLFVNFEEVVGLRRYLKAPDSVADEDHRQNFPRRRDDPAPLVAVLPSGTRINYVSDLPMPADGPNTQRLRDGSQFETTYRGGRAEGAFRWIGSDGAVRANGTLADGWPQGPVTIFDRAGRALRQEEYPRPRIFVGPGGDINLTGTWSLTCLLPASRPGAGRESQTWDMEIRDEAGRLTAVLTARDGRTLRLTGTRNGRAVQFSSPLPDRIGALAGALQSDHCTLRDAQSNWVARPLR